MFCGGEGSFARLVESGGSEQRQPPTTLHTPPVRAHTHEAESQCFVLPQQHKQIDVRILRRMVGVC